MDYKVDMWLCLNLKSILEDKLIDYGKHTRDFISIYDIKAAVIKTS